MVTQVAGGGDLGRVEAGVTPALVLASTSPQRRSILEQLQVPFTAEAPAYEEHDPPDADPAVVAGLRAKVEDVPSSPTLIRTVRGVGYRLDVPA